MMTGGPYGAAWQGFAVAARNWSARTGAALQQARASEVAEGHAALQVALGALRTTSASLANRLRAPVPAAARPARPPASLTGFLPALGSLSTLQATRAVNEGISTLRRSAAPVGLDVTSPETTSVLQGTAAIGLDVASAEAASTLQSAAEANTAATSYGVVQAAFTRGGTTQGSLGNLSGVYTGTGAASAATSLRIRISSPDSVIGAVPAAVSFRVFDQAGTSVASFNGLVTAGESISLGPDIGLSLSFTAGSILRNAETTFSVSKTTPTDVDPDATFNHANVNLRPRFENGAQVTAGSFTVNGTQVDVLAGDTIHTVLARLNSTVAGVAASFSGDRVHLQTTAASEEEFVLGNDTSGFLAALKLDGAVTTPGNVRDDRQVLSRTAAFAGVTSGSFSVNGAVIAVDAGADTLQAVLDRINAAGAGVIASHDAVADRVRLESVANSEDDIVLAGDSTGLLAALNLAGAATARGHLHDDTQRLATVSALAGVTAGSFRVNGQTIAVDPETDDLQAILARVNASGAVVTASYDAVLDEVVLSPDTTGAPLALEEDTSGFLAAVGLAEGAAGTAVNPAAAFNGTGLASPFFDEGRAVVAGGFRVNGVYIGVAADDTLQAVLDRITQSSAGVAAIFDAATERVTLAAKAVGSSPIEVGEDTSGFLAAVKLDETAVSVPGQGGVEATLASQPALAGVGAGVITVNGRTVEVNPAAQNLSGLAAALDGLEGVRFTLETATGRVRLEAERAWEPLDVADTSGLLAALGIPSGRVEATSARVGPAVWPAPAASRPAVGAAEARKLAEEVAGALGDLNDAVAWIAFASDAAAAYQNDVFAAVRGAVAGWGSRAVALEETDGLLQLGADGVGLETALRTDARSLADFLGGAGGLVTALEAVLQSYERNAESMREPSAYALAQARRAYGF